MVQVTVCGGSQLEGPEANVVKGLVVNAESFVCVLDLQIIKANVKIQYIEAKLT